MQHPLELSRAVRRVALAMVVGLAAAVGLAAPASAQTPSVCLQNNSGYYCYYTGTSRSGTNWTHNSTWSGSIKSYPLFLRDKVRSWDQRRTSGWYIWNYNWRSSSGQWEWIFTMYSNSYNSNQPSKSPADSNADALEVFYLS